VGMSLNQPAVLQGKNLIINGRLGSDTMVNQRGFVSGTLADDDYGFDRWVSKSGASSIVINASSITLTSGKLVQFIENPFIGGQAVTVSANVSSGTLTGRLGTTDAFKTLPFTTTAPSGDIRLELVGDGSEFTDVKLELGYVATDFEHRSYGEELALCQRYFYRYQGGGISEIICVAMRYSNGSAYGVLTFPVKMRARPSLSASGNFQELYPATAVTVSTLSGNASQHGGSLGWASAATQGQATTLRANLAASYISWDAEL
jgi:hypothetical protein